MTPLRLRQEVLGDADSLHITNCSGILRTAFLKLRKRFAKFNDEVRDDAILRGLRQESVDLRLGELFCQEAVVGVGGCPEVCFSDGLLELIEESVVHSVPMSFRSVRQGGESPSVLVEVKVATDGLTTSVEAHGDWYTQCELGSCLKTL